MLSRTAFLIGAGLTPLIPRVVDAQQSSESSHFDVNRFDAILAKRALHKQCFGSTSRLGGRVLYMMNNSIEAYHDVLKEPEGSMHAIGVLYGGDSIALAYDDTLWNELLIPHLGKTGGDGPLSPGDGNPYKDNIAGLIAQGSNFFACQNAFREDAAGWSRITNRIPNEMYDYMSCHLLPGTMLVPASVMALNAAQEAHFTYVSV